MKDTIPPYNFMPVEPGQCERREPVWHDSFPQPERLSGRIRCSAFALTPLIVGNVQVAFKDLALDDPERAKIGQPQQGQRMDADHKLLRPFRFPDGRFGIPASALKGMVAQVYAAITHSPIERVNDRTFSFRPNMGFGNSGPRPMAGILLRDDNGWQVLTFEVDREKFCKSDNRVSQDVEKWLAEADVAGLDGWLQRAPERPELLLPCGGGIDGEGRFEACFHGAGGQGRGRCSQQKLKVSREMLKRDNVLPLPPEIKELYEVTLEHLSSDHLDAHPNANDTEKIKKAIERTRRLKPGKVVFVEVLGNRIVSLGMHFRYRWRYCDSITDKNKGLCGKEVRRPQFDTACETNQQAGDVRLSPRRRLFGFVDPNASSGNGRLNALAGRVRFSFAQYVESASEGKKVKEYVPLQILGTPKASSYEFYLTQPESRSGLLCDYGDTADPDRRGEPRGRKFYLHQPEAAWDNKRYRMQPGQSDEGLCNKLNQTVEALLAPEVQADGPDRFPTFRFTVLFENLDEWELDRLVLALGLGNDEISLDHTGKTRDMPLYNRTDNSVRAHKIGHGRPLGLGSLLVRLDQVELLAVENGQPAWRDAPEWIRPKTQLPPALASLTAFRRAPADVVLGYPRPGGEDSPIHDFHSKARTAQAGARRGKDGNPLQYALPTAETVWNKPIKSEVDTNRTRSAERPGYRPGGGDRGRRR